MACPAAPADPPTEKEYTAAGEAPWLALAVDDAAPAENESTGNDRLLVAVLIDPVLEVPLTTLTVKVVVPTT